MNNDEKPTKPEKKPRIGGIGQQRSQYSTIGGQRQDSQTSERLSVETSKDQSPQTFEPPDAKTLKRPDSQAWEGVNLQSRTKRHTIYLSPSTSRWIKIHAASTDREISEIAEIAIQHYRSEIEGK